MANLYSESQQKKRKGQLGLCVYIYMYTYTCTHMQLSVSNQRMRATIGTMVPIAHCPFIYMRVVDIQSGLGIGSRLF